MPEEARVHPDGTGIPSLSTRFRCLAGNCRGRRAVVARMGTMRSSFEARGDPRSKLTARGRLLPVVLKGAKHWHRVRARDLCKACQCCLAHGLIRAAAISRDGLQKGSRGCSPDGHMQGLVASVVPAGGCGPQAPKHPCSGHGLVSVLAAEVPQTAADVGGQEGVRVQLSAGPRGKQLPQLLALQVPEFAQAASVSQDGNGQQLWIILVCRELEARNNLLGLHCLSAPHAWCRICRIVERSACQFHVRDVDHQTLSEIAEPLDQQPRRCPQETLAACTLTHGYAYLSLVNVRKVLQLGGLAHKTPTLPHAGDSPVWDTPRSGACGITSAKQRERPPPGVCQRTVASRNSGVRLLQRCQELLQLLGICEVPGVLLLLLVAQRAKCSSCYGRQRRPTVQE
mmetsp:Transcript_82319/g.245483  ORF Transcript_82319/g.245483 Transcript_82319/m.245483 type:complete len:398 (-) Transcript_82319:60-1253(-)